MKLVINKNNPRQNKKSVVAFMNGTSFREMLVWGRFLTFLGENMDTPEKSRNIFHLADLGK